MNKFFALSILAVGIVSQSQAVLINGSFENGPIPDYYAGGTGDTTVTGWTGINTGFEWLIPSTIYGGVFGAACDGLAIVDVANFTNNLGGIEQTFTTTIGQMYLLSYCAGTSNYAGRTGTGILEISIDGNTYTNSLSNANLVIAWNTYSIPFTATQTSTTLKFINREDANTHFAFVDNASVEAVPEPATMLALSAGLAALARKKRNKA